ncbi:MAG: hypothetical protein QM788_05400 [Roseateles sp.]
MKPRHPFAPGVIEGAARPRHTGALAVCLVLVIACISAASLLLGGGAPL